MLLENTPLCRNELVSRSFDYLKDREASSLLQGFVVTARLYSNRQMQHAFILLGFCCAAFVDFQFAQIDQQGAGDVAAEPQQFGGMDLVVVAKTIGRAQQAALDVFVEVV